MLSVPLSFLGISLAVVERDYYIPFLLTVSGTVAILLYLLNRFYIKPRIPVLQECPPKLLRIFLAELLIGISLLTINMMYGEAEQYPSNILTMNGILISLLSLSSILLFFSLYEILLRNQRLAVQQKEQAVTAEYLEQMEGLYEEMRTFRHDYKNILCTMEDYITSGDLENLENFFHNKILPTSTLLPGQNLVIGRLGLIHVPPVKSLLCSKLGLCQKHGIPFTLELPRPVDDFYIDVLQLSTVLGILLDNAIEASLSCKEPKLELSILSQDNSVSIGIRNSSVQPSVPVSQLCDRGYTTKDGHTGLGLNTVKRILAPLDNAYFTIEYSDNTFFVKLDIWKEENDR